MPVMTGKTIQEIDKASQLEYVYTRLQQIDLDKIRPVSSILVDGGTEEDHGRLASLEEESRKLRKQLYELT